MQVQELRELARVGCARRLQALLLMALPLEITFRHLDPSAALEAAAREQADQLRRIVPSILGCSVTVEPGFRVRVSVDVPNHPPLSGAATAAKVTEAMRAAFRTAGRGLTELQRRAPQEATSAEAGGRVLAVSRSHGFGVIEADDGHHVFFEARSVRGGLEQLRAGSRVRFAADPEAPRLQAAMVVAAVA